MPESAKLAAIPTETALMVSEEDLYRANLYTVIGRLLAGAPDAALLDTLSQPQAGEESGPIAAAWATLRLAAAAAEPEAVADEYHDLFIGIGRGELVPYASWYLTGFLMDQPLLLLRRDLAALGIGRPDGVAEPEDHAGALCEAMALVIGDETGEFATQQNFFGAHLGTWIDTFFRDLQTAQSARFYRAVGQLGEALIALDRRYLAMEV